MVKWCVDTHILRSSPQAKVNQSFYAVLPTCWHTLCHVIQLCFVQFSSVQFGFVFLFDMQTIQLLNKNIPISWQTLIYLRKFIWKTSNENNYLFIFGLIICRISWHTSIHFIRYSRENGWAYSCCIIIIIVIDMNRLRSGIR